MMAKINSLSDVTEILSIAQYFQPKMTDFVKRDPYQVLKFFLWGLHEEVNFARLKSIK